MVDQRGPDDFAPLVKERRISIPLSEDAFNRINQLAWRNHTSVAYIGRIAVLQLLLADVKGEFSLVPEFQPGREIPKA